MNALLLYIFFHNFLCDDAGVCFFFLDFWLKSRPCAVAPAEVKNTDLVDKFDNWNYTFYPVIVNYPAIKRRNNAWEKMQGDDGQSQHKRTRRDAILRALSDNLVDLKNCVIKHTVWSNLASVLAKYKGICFPVPIGKIVNVLGAVFVLQ